MRAPSSFSSEPGGAIGIRCETVRATAVVGEGMEFSAEYAGGLADHLPMTLSALRHLGATDERCATYARTYVTAKHLRPIERGDGEYDARVAMRGEIAGRGRNIVLEDELRLRSRHIGASAFHAIIRVAYGIVDTNDAEIAAGLAYWRDAPLDLGDRRPGPIDQVTFNARTALTRAREALAPIVASLDDRALISERMRAVSRDPAFDAAIGTPRFDSDAVASIAAMTLRAFAATQNFTLLHAMTGTHALRIVLPFAPDRERLLDAHWRAIVAAYVSAGAPAVPDDSSFEIDLATAPPWTALLERARVADDEHVIKAAYTAWREDAVYHDPLYRVAIARYNAARLPVSNL